MKVLQIITKGEAGGAQTHLAELCQALPPQTVLTVIIGGAANESYLDTRLEKLGLQPRYLSALTNSLSPWALLRASWALYRQLRQLRPDLIHAHSAIAGAAARLAGLMAGIPVIYTVHGFGFKPEIPGLQRLAAFSAEWVLAPVTRHMICVSAHERALARRLPLSPRRISVIGNAIQDHPARALPATHPMRVVMVARCAPPKRHDVLLAALALAATRLGEEIPATLVGGGPQLNEWQALASQLGLRQVRFTGDIGDVPELLARHHVFVLMSDHEGQPISIIEALRSGLPVIGSDLPGLRELIKPDHEGWLLPNQPAALADALISLQQQPQRRTRMGQAARQRYEQQCAPQPMARAVQSLYDQILPHG